MKQRADDFYHGPTLRVTINSAGVRLHRLIDDAIPQARACKIKVRRDPMVEALFGAPGGGQQALLELALAPRQDQLRGDQIAQGGADRFEQGDLVAAAAAACVGAA